MDSDPRIFDPLGLSLNFVHKRIFGAAKAFIGTGSPIAAIGAFAAGGGSEGRSGSSVVPQGVGLPVPGLDIVRIAPPVPVDPCAGRGMTLDRAGRCVPAAGISGIGPGAGLLDPLGLDIGARLRGAFAQPAPPIGPPVGVAMIGASAVAPFRTTTVIRRCGRGFVLATDGLCYDRKTLRKDQRMWPPGRKPLLTGGQLNAIAIAAKAAGRIKTQTKRLQKLGMLQKPKSTRKAIAPVSHHHD